MMQPAIDGHCGTSAIAEISIGFIDKIRELSARIPQQLEHTNSDGALPDAHGNYKNNRSGDRHAAAVRAADQLPGVHGEGEVTIVLRLLVKEAVDRDGFHQDHTGCN